MAGKMSPSAALRVAELEAYMPKVMHLNNLIENYAAAKVGADNFLASLKRAADQLKMKLLSAGFAQMSQLCGAIVMTASRAGNQNTKTRALREHMGNLKFQLEFEIRSTIREDELARSKAGEA
jgi:hypothetical protein